jgi:TonB family protein
MTEVTDVIVSRRTRQEPFNAMLVGSLIFHTALIIVLLFGPLDWGIEAEVPRTVMTISLTPGPPGPRTGITTEGGRAVAPPPPEAVPKAMPPPPPKPENVVPTQTRRTPPAKPKVEEEPRPGVTKTETGARGQGFGLSASGGNVGAGVQLDVANFCCPEYIQQMVTLIQRNWQQNQGVRGNTGMKFTITRGGSIQDVSTEKPSGFVVLDLAAERALLTTRLPELPPQFPNPSLTVHITFEYQR